jgi:hypothetical protein
MSKCNDASLDDVLSEEDLDASDQTVTAAIKMMVDGHSLFGLELDTSGSETSRTDQPSGQTLSSYIRSSRGDSGHPEPHKAAHLQIGKKAPEYLHTA